MSCLYWIMSTFGVVMLYNKPQISVAYNSLFFSLTELQVGEVWLILAGLSQLELGLALG